MHLAKIDTDNQADAFIYSTSLHDLVKAKAAAVKPHGYLTFTPDWPGQKAKRVERRPIRRPAAYDKAGAEALLYSGVMYDTVIVDDLIDKAAHPALEKMKSAYYAAFNAPHLWNHLNRPIKMLEDKAEILAVLDGTIAFLKEDNWTTGALARDRYGRKVNPDSPDAVKWCAMGALYKVFGAVFHGSSPLQAFLDRAVYDFTGGRECGVPKFNDTIAGHVSQVRRMLCHARDMVAARMA